MVETLNNNQQQELNQQDEIDYEDEVCRVFDRLGVCLEPDMCPFRHPQA
jgi:hypothetical protein